MRSFADTIKAIFIKDIITEFRSRQVLPAVIIFGIIIAWVFRIVSQSGTADSGSLTAAVLVVALLFAVILTGERAFAVEQQNDCISGLLMGCGDVANIYLAKLLVNVAMLCIFEIFVIPAVFVLFNISAGGRLPELIIVLLVNTGVSSLATLLGCVVQGTKAQNALLSILVMAVLAPMVIPAVAALMALFGSWESADFGSSVLNIVGGYKRAVGFLAAFDVIFVTLCWLLFGFVVEE